MKLNARMLDRFGNPVVQQAESTIATSTAETHIARIRLATQAVTEARQKMLEAQARYIDACEHLWAVCHYGEISDPQASNAVAIQEEAVLTGNLATIPMLQVPLGSIGIPSGIVKLLANRSINLLGDIFQRTGSLNPDWEKLTSVPGIGLSKVEAIKKAITEFQAKRG